MNDDEITIKLSLTEALFLGSFLCHFSRLREHGMELEAQVAESICQQLLEESQGMNKERQLLERCFEID